MVADVWISFCCFFQKPINCHWIELRENLQGSKGFSRSKVLFLPGLPFAVRILECMFSGSAVLKYKDMGI